MKKKECFFSKKKRKIATAFFAVFILVIAIFSINSNASDEADVSPNLLNNSELALGSSNLPQASSSPFAVAGVTVSQSGTVTDGNLKLKVDIPSNEVLKVTMTTPGGVEETKEIITTFSNSSILEEGIDAVLQLGSSGIAQEEAEKADNSPIATSDVATLGSSGSDTPDKAGESVVEIKPNITSYGGLYSTGVEFDAPEYGMYVFELYGAGDVLLDRISYLAKAVLKDGALLVTLTTNYPTFNIEQASVHNALISYEPLLIGKKEVVTIIVPPMYTIVKPPTATDNFVVSPVQTMDLPKELYDDEASKILASFGERAKVQYFTMTFDGSVSKRVGVSFDFKYDATRYKDMSELMVKYGTEVDNIPLRMGGYSKAVDDGTLIDKEVINGTAMLANPTTILLPNKNTNVKVGQEYKGDILSDKFPRVGFNVKNGHYPITDVSIYYAYDPTKLTPKVGFSGEKLEINGITYWKHTLKDSEGPFYNINEGSLYHVDYNNFDFPLTSAVKEGDIINFGPMLADYTTKGVKYERENMGNSQPLTINNFIDLKGIAFNFKGTPGNWGTNELDKELEQGTSGEKFLFHFGNYDNYGDYPTYTYEEAQVIFDMPYGVYTTAIYIDRAPRKSIIESIEYYLVDAPTVAVFEYPAVNSGLITLNPPAGKKIGKVIINYDAIHGSTQGSYYIHAEIGKTKPDGTPFSTRENVAATISIKPKNGLKTMGIDSPDPVYELFTYSHTANFYLVRYEKEDSLRFGSVTVNTANISLYESVETKIEYNLGAGFKKQTSLMKDYENVVVEVLPYNGETRLLSLIKGYYLAGLTPGKHVEKNEVYYKSNVKLDWTLAETVSGAYHNFDLDPTKGEYVTNVKVELGTLYGDQITATIDVTSTIDAGGYAFHNGNRDHYLSPIMFESKRAFFDNSFGNSPDREELPLGDTSYGLEYNVSTTSEAQYINKIGTPATLNSNKSKNTGKLLTFKKEFFDFQEIHVQPQSDSTGQGEMLDVRLYINSQFKLSNPDVHYYTRVYLEVHKDFSIVNIPGTTLVDVITATDTGNKVYIYDAYLGKGSDYRSNIFDKMAKMYLHPNATAPVAGGVKPIVKAAIDENAFYESYMTATNYHYPPPYTYYTHVGTIPYEEWTGPEIQFRKLFFKLDKMTYNKPVSPQVSAATGVSTIPIVDNNIQEGTAVFREHDKDGIGTYVVMGNMSGGEIAHFEARLKIPKINRITETPNAATPGVPQQLTNKYDMYVKGPVQSDQTLDITYLKEDGVTPVTVNAATSKEELESIYDVIIRFKNFKDRTNIVATIPLATDFVKTGNDFEPHKSYLGASSRYIVSAGGEWNEYSLANALEHQYLSYSTTIRIGQDTKETGQYQTAITDPAIVKVQSYYDDNGVEKELETLNIGGTLQFNRDATRLTATVLMPDAFYISPEGYSKDENNDSDFIVTSQPGDPKITGEVILDWNDLEKGTANKYDLALYALPDVTVPDSLSVPVHTTVNVAPVIKQVYKGLAIPSPPLSLYVRELSDNISPTVATITDNVTTKQIDITGMESGKSTTYLFSVTNRFGDKFTVAQPVKVNVVANYAPTASVKKLFDTATRSKNLGTDKFDFEIWSSKDVDDRAKMYTISGVDQNTAMPNNNKLERGPGELNFIREIPKLGYTSLGFTVTHDNNIPVTVSFVKDGIYSFELPLTANNVIVTAINKNSESIISLKKDMDAATIAYNPNQEFTIVVREKGQITPVVTAKLKGGDAQDISLVFGRTYEMEETAVSDYFLDTVTIEKAGSLVGTQPVKPTTTNNNLYEFTLQTVQDGSQILVNNKLSRGKGIILNKEVILDSGLGRESFTFVLEGPAGTNPEKVYGIVPENTTTFPALVKWYKTNDITGEVAEVDELKLGVYTLTEAEGTNYQLDKFTHTTGTLLPESTDKILKFDVTPNSPLINATAKNITKTAGKVEVTKIISPLYKPDTMEFTITHLSTDTEYKTKAIVSANNFVFTEWTVGGVAVPTSQLPFGTYKIVETLEGYYHAFDKFHPQAGLTIDAGGLFATFTLDSTTTAINITAENKVFEKGEISIVAVPNLDYGLRTIGEVANVVNRTADATVQIKSTLRVTNTWQLTARSNGQKAGTEPLTYDLPYQMLKHSKDGTNYGVLNAPVIIMNQNDTKVGDFYTLNWLPTESGGIVAEQRFAYGMLVGKYSSTITWSLAIVP